MNRFSLILCLLVLTPSCQMHHVGNIYKPGREWEFEVKNSRSLQVTKMRLTVLNEDGVQYQWGRWQTKIEWSTVVRHEDGSFDSIREQTGVVDETDPDMSDLPPV